MNRKVNLVLKLWVATLFSATNAQEIDYTCDPRMDYLKPKEPGTCPEENIQDGACDNPNHGGTNDLCVKQDCIDCNYHCRAFDADCFGCLNAKGCYYCPGDATCQNSNLYKSESIQLSCTTESDFWLGGDDDPEELCIASDSTTQDPLSVANDWAYTMINVDKVWQDLNYTGRGIRIRINDDGVDVDNADFLGRFDEANSCDSFAPSPDDADGHGTKVAGILSGNANNAHCAAGVAYDSTFSSCNVVSGGLNYQDLNNKLESFDISQNSIGLVACASGDSVKGLQTTCPFTVPSNALANPCDEVVCDFANLDTSSFSVGCENAIFTHCKYNFRDDETACLDFIDTVLFGGTCDYDKLPQAAVDVLQDGVINGREGKGVIFVYASGNDFFEGDDVNFSRWTNSRYTITVGAVGKDGFHTDYSTPGAALFVVAPAGDYDDASHIMTTGLGGGCVNSGTGTSFSSPIVSGVVALMLEARPELTWRDVQGILALTSTATTDTKDTSVATNKAGFTHSNWYGFGVIDAQKAVSKALAWQLWTPEYQAIGESAEENQAIPNDGTEYVSELQISNDYKGFTAESTVVLLNLQHYNRGDLELTLVSPDNTESILHPGKRPENNQLGEDERWKLMTVRNWGEDPTGTWKLKIKDLVTGNESDGANELRQWKLVVYGRTADGLPPTLTVQSEAPSQATTTPPTRKDESAAPTSSPTEKGVTRAPVAPSDAPSKAPTSTPSVLPTITPGRRTSPPIIRPTFIVKSSQQHTVVEKNPDPDVEQPDQSTGTLPETGTALDRDVPGLTDSLGGKINRPVYLIGRDRDAGQQAGTTITRVSTLRSFDEEKEPNEQQLIPSGSEEESFEQHSRAELVQNLSLVFEGVSQNIAKRWWPSIQTAIEEHTTSVVHRIMPALRFKSEVQLISFTVNEPDPDRKRRNLRLDNENPSVTIVYDELVHFDDVDDTYNLKGITLAALAFHTPDDRAAFVAKIHIDLDEEHPRLRPLVSVSPLILPPTPSPVAIPTEAWVPTKSHIIWSSENGDGSDIQEASGNNSDIQEISGDESKSSDSASHFTVIVGAMLGASLLCATLLVVLRRRRDEGANTKITKISSHL